MNKRRMVLLIGLAAAVIFIGGATLVGLLIWRDHTLPVYTMAQEQSPDGQRVTETLSLNGTLYVHSRPEFPLDTIGRSPQIGKAEGGMRIYAPDGWGTNPEFVFMNGFMFPNVVYRRADVPPFDPLNIAIGEIQMAENKGFNPLMKRTKDAALIAEVIARLKDRGPSIPATEEYDLYHVDLLSPEVPGISYFLYVAVTPDNRVFLAEKWADTEWFTAGERFTQWVLGIVGTKRGQAD